jgi:hypothetical protein
MGQFSLLFKHASSFDNLVVIFLQNSVRFLRLLISSGLKSVLKEATKERQVLLVWLHSRLVDALSRSLTLGPLTLVESTIHIRLNINSFFGLRFSRIP